MGSPYGGLSVVTSVCVWVTLNCTDLRQKKMPSIVVALFPLPRSIVATHFTKTPSLRRLSLHSLRVYILPECSLYFFTGISRSSHHQDTTLITPPISNVRRWIDVYGRTYYVCIPFFPIHEFSTTTHDTSCRAGKEDTAWQAVTVAEKYLNPSTSFTMSVSWWSSLSEDRRKMWSNWWWWWCWSPCLFEIGWVRRASCLSLVCWLWRRGECLVRGDHHRYVRAKEFVIVAVMMNFQGVNVPKITWKMVWYYYCMYSVFACWWQVVVSCQSLGWWNIAYYVLILILIVIIKRIGIGKSYIFLTLPVYIVASNWWWLGCLLE